MEPTLQYIYIYIYIYIYSDMVDFGESDEIKGKVDKSDTYNGFSNISFFIQRTSSDKTFFEFFYILANEKIKV